AYQRLVGRGLYKVPDPGGVCAISANHSDELFAVMAAHGESGQSALSELRGAPLVALLAAVLQLRLDQCAELGVRSVRRIGRAEGQNEVGDMAEPLPDLLLGASLGPSTHGARRADLSLADDGAALTRVSGCRPQRAYTGLSK